MKKTFHIEGMHCPSCELSVRQAIKDAGCECSVSSCSHVSGQLTVSAKKASSFHQLMQAVEGLGYVIHSDEQMLPQSKKPNILFVLRWMLVSLFFVFLLFTLNTNTLLASTGGTTLWSAVILGLIASVSTCLAVTGGIIIGYTKILAQQEKQGSRTHISFHLGRVVSFVIGGALLGLVGGTFSPSIPMTVVINTLVACILMYLGLQSLGVLPPLSRWISLPGSWGATALKLKHPRYAPLVGALTFFLPCGFTQSMQVLALTSGSAALGAGLLGAFALGTLPVLLGVSFGTSFLERRLQFFRPVLTALILAFGLFTLINTFQLGKTLMHGSSAEINNTNTMTVLNVGHDGYQFIPKTISIPQGQDTIVRVLPSNNGLGCMGSVAFEGTSYPIIKGQSFDLVVNASTPRRIQLVCASMGMNMGEIVIE